MSRTIAIVSGKGGVGKTVTTANLALSLQKFGEDVLAVDCDQTASNLALHLDMHPAPHENVQNVINGDSKVLDAISVHETGLMVMPSAHLTKAEELSKNRLKKMMNRIKGTVIIDSPPGISQNVRNIIDVADEIFLVTNPEIPAVSDAVKIAEAVEEIKGHRDNVWTIVNKADFLGKQVSLENIEKAVEAPVIGKIPHEREMKEAIHEQEPVIHYAPYSKSAIEFNKMVAWLTNNHYEPPKTAALKRILKRFTR